MDTIKIDSKKCLLIAHRGVSKLETENTAAAFIAAGNRGYYGIETDVRITSDGRFVILHDADTSRVSGEALTAEDSTLEQLRGLTLFARDGAKRGDLILPTLEEYIRICKYYGKTAVLELKGFMPPEAIFKMAGIIEGMGYLENVIFISFAAENLIALRTRYPSQPAQFLVGSDFSGYSPAELVGFLKKHNLDLDIHCAAIDKELADILHKENIKINAWTVDSPEMAELLISWGVDFITTNILE